MTGSSRVIYNIDVPYGEDTIEVYGDPHMGWYEWRVVTPRFEVIRDSKDRGYGAPGIALRDALVEVTA